MHMFDDRYFHSNKTAFLSAVLFGPVRDGDSE